MGAWEGGPVGPGPPPLGSWGASQGLPGGVPDPKLQYTTSSRRPFELALKFILILMSIFDRFGLDLGSLLGVIFGHVGAFFGPSWSRNRLRTDLSSKKRFFTKHYVFQYFFHFFDPKMEPKRAQDRTKSAPRGSQR